MNSFNIVARLLSSSAAFVCRFAARRAPRPAQLACFLLAMALLPALASADTPRRVLQVSLYPYIPEAADAALTLKQDFERQHPDVIVDITLNRHYYSPDPADKGVLYEDADVHEIDVIFLKDFLDRHKLAPLSADFAKSTGKLVPLAVQAATADGKLVAVPQWMCADFLIYRADKTGIADAHSLADVERALGANDGLLMNLSGSDTLGELYLSALIARDDSPETALAHVGADPDPEILARLKRIMALEPAGFGRNPDYAKREDFYARQFARRRGGAFVGYSELTHDVLDETSIACRQEDRCVTAGDIGVAPFPFADGKVRPMVWVDMFGIDARVHGKTLTDAEEFIRYAVSLPAYRALLIPESDGIPRYLLPATEAAFSDPEILKTAPLYPKFRAIMDQGVVVTVPDLNARLHTVAAKIDLDLPQNH
jgi:thiamine pyridinylase